MIETIYVMEVEMDVRNHIMDMGVGGKGPVEDDAQNLGEVSMEINGRRTTIGFGKDVLVPTRMRFVFSLIS